MAKYRGLGDLIEATIKGVGLDSLAPDDCGCSKRRDKLNSIIPFKDAKRNKDNA